MLPLLVGIIKAASDDSQFDFIKNDLKLTCDDLQIDIKAGIQDINPGQTLCTIGCYLFGTLGNTTVDVRLTTGKNSEHGFKWQTEPHVYSNPTIIYDYQPITSIKCLKSSEPCSIATIPFQCGVTRGKNGLSDMQLAKELYALYPLEPAYLDFTTSVNNQEYIQIIGASNGMIRNLTIPDSADVAMMFANGPTPDGLTNGEVLKGPESLMFYNATGGFSGRIKYEFLAPQKAASDDTDEEDEKTMKMFPTCIGKIPGIGVYTYVGNGESFVAASQTKPTPDPKKPEDKGGLNKWVIIGIAIGAVVLVIIIVSIIVCACKSNSSGSGHKKGKKKSKKQSSSGSGVQA